MTPLFLWLLRILVLILIVRLIIRGVSALTAGAGIRRGSARMPERAGGTLVRDPHCGTFIPERRALVIGAGADALHFCSAECREAWLATHGRHARVKA